ncbi:hypothetical protein [Noviherbaspirillum sedimenti]|nr:hypothetical protein [Noviherbaspirillum sedimenti]
MMNILVVDDHAVVRAGVHHIIGEARMQKSSALRDDVCKARF